MDGGGAIAIINLGSCARLIAGGAALRSSLGYDRGGTSASTSCEECEGKDRLRLFYALSRHLADERDEVCYANLSAALGVAETVVKKQLYIMRQRYRSLLRDEVTHTVENPADIQDEIRYLCAALAAADQS